VKIDNISSIPDCFGHKHNLQNKTRIQPTKGIGGATLTGDEPIGESGSPLCIGGDGQSLYNGVVDFTIGQIAHNNILYGCMGFPIIGTNNTSVHTRDATGAETKDKALLIATEIASAVPHFMAMVPVNLQGVSAHFAAQRTLSYYYNNFHRNSLDDKAMEVNCYTNMAQLDGNGMPSLGNALWSANYKAMFCTEGEPSITLAPISLDIIGHELTHGVTQFSSNLKPNVGESGALNEGFSDIFGENVEYYTKSASNPGFQSNWTLGEDVTLNKPFHRSLKDPKAATCPDTYKGINWDFADEAHTNSTVLSHWFYLLVVGGKVTNDNGCTFNIKPISRKNAEKIAYETLINLTSGATYLDTRDVSIKQTEIIFGANSQEFDVVQTAWDAVGVNKNQSSSITIDFYPDANPNIVANRNKKKSETSTSFDATWLPVQGISSYTLNVSKLAKDGITSIPVITNELVNGTLRTVKNVEYGNVYHYTVAPANAGCASAASADVYIVTPTALSALNIKKTSFDAQWKPVPVGNYPYSFDTYIVQVSQDPNFTNSILEQFIVNPMTSSITISNLTPGTTYYYRVETEINVLGTSIPNISLFTKLQDWSNVISVTLPLTFAFAAAPGNNDGVNTTTFAAATSEIIESKVTLIPNPFQQTLNVKLSLSYSDLVTLKLYTILGKEVATICSNQFLNAGEHSIEWDASFLPSGTYFYHAQSGSNTFRGIVTKQK
jgi:hypothetical protein